MSAEIRPRRGAAERVTGIIWGAIVAATGALTIAALSGYDVDLEVLAIVALVVLGGWLLASALAAASRQSRQERAAFAGTGGTAGDDAPVAAVDEVGAPEGSDSPPAGEAPLAPTAEMPAPRSQTAGHTWAEPAQRWDETADTEVIAAEPAEPAEPASDTPDPDTSGPETADGERRTDQ